MQKQGRQLQNAMITMNHRLSCPAPQLWFGPGTRAVDLMVIKGLELCSVGTSLGDTEDLRHDRLFFCTDHISTHFQASCGNQMDWRRATVLHMSLNPKVRTTTRVAF